MKNVDLDRKLRDINFDRCKIYGLIVQYEKGITALQELKVEVTIMGEVRVCDFEQEVQEIRGVIACLHKEGQALEAEYNRVFDQWLWSGCPSARLQLEMNKRKANSPCENLIKSKPKFQSTKPTSVVHPLKKI